eukprot:m.84288 g.84288  ORF g.84288 m.84288 type:complete len:460 (+) comp14796_c0_seq2:129-1508(+)
MTDASQAASQAVNIAAAEHNDSDAPEDTSTGYGSPLSPDHLMQGHAHDDGALDIVPLEPPRGSSPVPRNFLATPGSPPPQAASSTGDDNGDDDDDDGDDSDTGPVAFPPYQGGSAYGSRRQHYQHNRRQLQQQQQQHRHRQPQRTPHPPEYLQQGLVRTESDLEDETAAESAADSLRRVGRAAPIERPAGEVALVVGGRRFICQVELFQKHPNSMLGRMFGSSFDLQLTRPNDKGDYVISHDISSSVFQAILDFYKHDKIRCPPNASVRELHEACSFFLVPFTPVSVKCQDVGKFLSVLSDNGAQNQFQQFLEEEIVPAMARNAQAGERDCHLVVLEDGDTIEWDDELPPGLGEQDAQIVRNTSLLRFLKFHENRTIAKRVLRERGLKHIKVGIEGFPTFVEKIRRGPGNVKVEVVYSYEQRPFLRLSWEQEEAKSRHVDFQCVRVRNPTQSFTAPSNA